MRQSLDDLMYQILVLRGGPGSGNWGHTGRAGKRGGSGGGGGLARIGAKPGSSHEERRGAAQKHRVTRLARDVAVISTKGDKLHLSTPYDPAFVSDLKNNITPSRRKWNASDRVWVVDASERKTAQGVMDQYFHVADQDKLGANGVKALKQKTHVARIKNNQKLIKQNEDAFRNKIDDLDETIQSYSYSSRSGRKMSAISDKALLEYALRDARAKPGKIQQDIQVRGMKAALRLMGIEGGV